jgi:peptide-methionine (S)-S-oxide reductase
MGYGRLAWIVVCLSIGIAVTLIARTTRDVSAGRREPAKPASAVTDRISATATRSSDSKQASKASVMKKATFGAGCFWGVEATFRRVPGVIDAAVGYAGGHTEKPTYKEVCTDRTGHAEVVEVQYDPSKVSYDQLLDVFWSSHDPTQVNRQGPDYGTQYRTVIFYHDEEQKAEAEASKQRLDASKRFGRPIATQIVPAGPFYRAEEYHQRYLEKRGLENCHI